MLNHHTETKEQPIQTYPYTTTFKTTDSPTLISCISWNLTHKDFINEYGVCPTSNELDWTHRLPKIKSKLSETNADIICLQEIDKQSFENDIGSDFQHKYHYNVKANYHPNQKLKNGKGGIIFSTAIMFKSSKFQCDYENYRGRAMILLLTNKLEKQNCNKCINNKHTCLYHSFFIACVHLESPRKGKNNETTRMNQIKAVLNRGIKKSVIDILKINQNDLNRFNVEIPDLRVIIMGDFNSGHNCDTSQMLLNNNNSYFQHLYTFKDAYHENIINNNYNCHKLATNNPNLRIKYFPTYAALGNIFSIDLMFYTANNMRLIGNTHTLPKMLKDKLNWGKVLSGRINEWIENDRKTNKNGQYNLCDFDNILFLPNKDIPSDHLPMGAIFEFNDLCHIKNENNKKCRCCMEYVPSDKEKKKKKKKKKKNI
eukprot:202175_1